MEEENYENEKAFRVKRALKRALLYSLYLSLVSVAVHLYLGHIFTTGELKDYAWDTSPGNMVLAVLCIIAARYMDYFTGVLGVTLLLEILGFYSEHFK